VDCKSQALIIIIIIIHDLANPAPSQIVDVKLILSEANDKP